MKKIFYAILCVLISTVILTSCASSKSISSAKEYVDEYYKNFSQQKSTQCYYQLNKNSADILEAEYNIGTENLLTARSKILGPVQSYEILSEEYFKDGQDKYVDFDILVKYQNAEINEKQQIVIKKDGQTSINVIEFDQDSVINELANSYKNSLVMDDFNGIKGLITDSYFLTKTEKNLKSIIEQAGLIGGKLWGGDIVEGNYIYEPVNDATYVYEVLIKLNYENDTMQNKIIIAEENGELGIAYIMILPEKILSFFESYLSYLKGEDKENVLDLYVQDTFEGSQDKMDTKWNLLQSYKEAYGQLTGYDVLAYGFDEITEPDGTQYEAIRVDAELNYEKKSVKHKLTLIEKDDGYVIRDQVITDD